MHGSVNCDSGENVEKVTQKTEKVGDGGEDSDKVTQKTGELVQESLSKSKEMEVVLALQIYCITIHHTEAGYVFHTALSTDTPSMYFIPNSRRTVWVKGQDLALSLGRRSKVIRSRAIYLCEIIYKLLIIILWHGTAEATARALAACSRSPVP